MTTLEALNAAGIAVALGADAMSVCMGIGVRWHGPRQKFRLAWHMGLFQFLMPILGWLAGRELAELLAGVGQYVAAALVFLIGAKMLYEALRARPGAVAQETEHEVEKVLHAHPKDPTRGWSLIVLSVATSIDALVVGFSLGLKGAGIWQASLLIGVVAALMALAGVTIGRRLGQALGRPAEAVGAVILLALGVVFLWMYGLTILDFRLTICDAPPNPPAGCHRPCFFSIDNRKWSAAGLLVLRVKLPRLRQNLRLQANLQVRVAPQRRQVAVQAGGRADGQHVRDVLHPAGQHEQVQRLRSAGDLRAGAVGAVGIHLHVHLVLFRIAAGRDDLDAGDAVERLDRRLRQVAAHHRILPPELREVLRRYRMRRDDPLPLASHNAWKFFCAGVSSFSPTVGAVYCVQPAAASTAASVRRHAREARKIVVPLPTRIGRRGHCILPLG